MSSLIIKGGTICGGEIEVAGNKNSVLPMLAALMLTDQESVLENVPDILDVHTMLDIAENLGAEYTFEKNTLRFRCKDIKTCSISKELCAHNRTSLLFAAPLLARCGKAELYPPGGDVIGRRRLDGHFYGLTKLGAEMDAERNVYRFHAANGLNGRELFLDEASVTATEQIIIAAATAKGTTTLYNAACEPHVSDLAAMLNNMGAKISGAGSNTITIEGVESLKGCHHRVTADYIEAGSFLALAAATNTPITLRNTATPRHYWMLRRVFERLGWQVVLQKDQISIAAGQDPHIERDFGGYTPQISDGTWPQYPSDMMSCTIVAATQSSGTVMFFEKMFESRIYFVDRLIGMGANAIVCDPHRVVITGRTPLYATSMASPDIRAGMAMVISACCAKGESRIDRAEVIYRGYEHLVDKLRKIGAQVEEA